MRKIFLLLLSFCVMSVVAQDMKSVFIATPDSIVPLLTKVNKEDCVDFLANNMKAVVKNRFGKVAELKELTTDYLFMQTTANSSIEMKLLPLNDSVKVICMIKTVCASACDSEMHFYDVAWNKLETSLFFQKPSAELFYISADTMSMEYAMVRKMANMDLMKATLSKEDTSLIVEYTTPDYLDKEENERLQPYLRKEPIVFRWSEGKFR